MFKNAIKHIEEEIRITNNLNNCLNSICTYLNEKIDGYHWVGYYFHNKSKQELELRSFSGIPTEHTKIPFGKGICGQSALSNDPILVDDVSEESNYISCNINVKSEIVVPLFNKKENIGQIDIDSNNLNQFTNKDLKFLEKINEMISNKFFQIK
jgi:GAF domain-containing protein|tara:strand:- start:109 stop:570 length:462 start_codon:yes stop_codon:yes gene_type:complete